MCAETGFKMGGRSVGVSCSFRNGIRRGFTGKACMSFDTNVGFDVGFMYVVFSLLTQRAIVYCDELKMHGITRNIHCSNSEFASKRRIRRAKEVGEEKHSDILT